MKWIKIEKILNEDVLTTKIYRLISDDKKKKGRQQAYFRTNKFSQLRQFPVPFSAQLQSLPLPSLVVVLKQEQ